MSGIGWLTGGLSTVSGILNTASSLASQIFSFLECTGLACETPSVWAANFGPSEKEADDWQKMVDNVNVFNDISKGLGSIEDALGETPLYAGITGLFNNAFSQCNEKVSNPTSQYDILPLPIGSKYKNCIPPIATIVGDGIGASATPIVDETGSVFSVEVITGGVGYTKATVTIVDNTGHGSGAYAKAIVSAAGTVSSIYLTDTGSGYCSGNYTNVGVGSTVSSGISSDVSGNITDVIVIKPGYGYTNGDTITDGKNTYKPIVTPGSGAIIGIQPLTNPIGGFKTTPTLTINTRTGVAANVVPLMKFTPIYNTVNQTAIATATATAISGIVTSVIDCV